MKNVIYTICEKLRGYSWTTEYFEVLKASYNHDDTYEIVVNPVSEDTEQRDVVYKICDSLRRCYSVTEYFEVLKVEQNEYDEYVILAKLINTEAENKEGANDDSNQ